MPYHPCVAIACGFASVLVMFASLYLACFLVGSALRRKPQPGIDSQHDQASPRAARRTPTHFQRASRRHEARQGLACDETPGSPNIAFRRSDSPIDEHRALGQGPPNLEELGMSESAALPSAPHERQHSDCMASEREKSIHSEPLLTPSQARILRQREVAMLQRNVALKAPTPDTRRSY